MNLKRFLLTLGALLALTVGAQAQSKNAPNSANPVPGEERPPTSGARSVEADPTKVCVIEVKPAKKVVYTSACRDYCVMHQFSLMHMFKKCCGMDDGEACSGCELHSKTVLIKKIVPGCLTPKCVLKDVRDLPPAMTTAVMAPETIPVLPMRK